jgi:hypothetical protein
MFLMIVFMLFMLVRFFFGVMVLDRYFNNDRLHIIFVWDLFVNVDFIRNFDFFHNWNFDFLHNRILLNVMMVHCVDVFCFVVSLQLTFKKCDKNIVMKEDLLNFTFDNLLLVIFAALNRGDKHG